ncbi:MAG: hypothetical protein JNM66_28400 [Bryobacterales bacterium]|nr:hypothetical protein [Bryobacterales bacterium]
MRCLVWISLAFGSPLFGQAALTVYNQHFAVVREAIPLVLKAGDNRVSYDGATALLEPGSVILRDRVGSIALSIREQSYQASPVSLASLLKLYEGQQISFLVREGNGASRVVPGRIVRAGGGGPNGQYSLRMPPQYAYQSPAEATVQPIVEWEGRLQFELPGTPLFPPLPKELRVKPVLEWVIASTQEAKVNAELSYVTGGLNWEADYNFVSAETGATVDVTGWVTVQNHSGRAFPKTRLKLMAGDVNKLLPAEQRLRMGGVVGGVIGGVPGGVGAAIQEKSFDEYHLYTSSNDVALADGESKQIEFLRVTGVPAKVVYVYEGAKLDTMRMRQYPSEMLRQDPSVGAESNPRVWAMREFANTTASKLGVPLPAGRLRFYRQDAGGEPEFVGESSIRHTPQGETVRVFTGAAFDLAGERRRLNFSVDHQRAQAEESFEIKLRNRKPAAVDVIVVEPLYRWSGWELFANSVPFQKTDSQTVEFRVRVEPGEEKVVLYSVRYKW